LLVAETETEAANNTSHHWVDSWKRRLGLWPTFSGFLFPKRAAADGARRCALEIHGVGEIRRDRVGAQLPELRSAFRAGRFGSDQHRCEERVLPDRGIGKPRGFQLPVCSRVRTRGIGIMRGWSPVLARVCESRRFVWNCVM